MSDSIALVVDLGQQGPSGAGITAGQWAALQAIVASDGSGNITAPGTLSVAGVASLNGDVNLGNNTTDTVTITAHVEGAGSPPSVVANAAAGTGATVSIVFGNDSRGLIHLTTGTGPTAGNVFTVTNFTSRADSNYVVLLGPADDNAAGASARVFANQGGGISTTFWTARVAAALPASTSLYVWYLTQG